jgi:hypothetical protein
MAPPGSLALVAHRQAQLSSQSRQSSDGEEPQEEQKQPERDGTEPAEINANERIAQFVMLLVAHELRDQLDQEHERQHQTAEQQQQAQAQRYAARPAVAVEPPSECRVCFDAPPTVTYHPCLHTGVCAACDEQALQMVAKENAALAERARQLGVRAPPPEQWRCPLCRMSVTQRTQA